MPYLNEDGASREISWGKIAFGGDGNGWMLCQPLDYGEKKKATSIADASSMLVECKFTFAINQTTLVERVLGDRYYNALEDLPW